MLLVGDLKSMISMEEYRDIVSELLDELPDEFFRELTGGVIVKAGQSVPDYALGNDLYTLGAVPCFSWYTANHDVQGLV